ncbi:hypothetical protein [Dactylosporangium darangshiense]|uniref:DUF4352 domain-containing protein n=1 Tax=Dactylosporangium darangshiense TaxID=579108 RepID=A0ABP8D7L0_9ACTN
MRRRLIVIVLTAVVVLLGGAGAYAVAHRDVAPADAPLALGTTALLRTDAGEARVTMHSAVARRTGCDQVRPSAAKVYLVADVTIEAVMGAWPVAADDFMYFAPYDGSSHSMSLAVGPLGADCGSDLPHRTLTAGGKVHGTVFFGRDAHSGEIYYSTHEMRNGVSWRVG